LSEAKVELEGFKQNVKVSIASQAIYNRLNFLTSPTRSSPLSNFASFKQFFKGEHFYPH